VLRRCMRINSLGCNMLPRCMDGRSLLVCKTTTISSIVRKSARCSPHARKPGSGRTIPNRPLGCVDVGSVIPWSPVARGALAKPRGESSLRAETDQFLKMLVTDSQRDSEKEIIDRVEALAKKKGVSMAKIATAWLLHKDGIQLSLRWTDDSCYCSDCRIEFGGED